MKTVSFSISIAIALIFWSVVVSTDSGTYQKVEDTTAQLYEASEISTQDTASTNSAHQQNVTGSVSSKGLVRWKHLEKLFPFYLAGKDYDGRPLWIMEYGKFNFMAVAQNGTEKLEELENYFQQIFFHFHKSIKDSSSTSGRTEFSCIMDMEGFDWRQLTSFSILSFLFKTARKYRAMVEVHTGGIVVINTSYLAYAAINLFRPLYGRVMERVEIYGPRKSTWLPVLRTKFPLSSLPPHYGGHKNFRPLQVHG